MTLRHRERRGKWLHGDDLMSNEKPPVPPEKRAKIELCALRNCLMPNEDDTLRKATTLVLVIGWLIWSIGLGTHTLNKGGAVLWGFTIYELFSFTVIYAFARLHDIEVKRLLGFGDDDGGVDRRDRRRRDPHSKREHERDEGGTGGFRYGDEGDRQNRRRRRRDEDDK